MKFIAHNAIIKAADIDLEDGGLLTWVALEVECPDYLLPGYVHRRNLHFSNRDQSLNGNFGFHFILRVSAVVGTRWCNLAGTKVRVRQEDVPLYIHSKAIPARSRIYAIGHAVKDDWFCPADDFQAMQRDASEVAA